MTKYFDNKPIHDGTEIIDGVTYIYQNRRLTEDGQYSYQRRIITTAKNWVKTGPWYLLYKNEMMRLTSTEW